MLFYLHRNSNKLIINYQSYPKSCAVVKAYERMGLYRHTVASKINVTPKGVRNAAVNYSTL